MAAADKCERFITVEMNMGQMIDDVKLAIDCKRPVDLCNRVGGMIPTPEDVLSAIQNAANGGEPGIMSVVFEKPNIIDRRNASLLPGLYPRYYPPSGGRGH